MSVFGRLDVYYPDGRIESYTLQGETVSVGRAPGNTIALDTDTISRYHFSITHKNDVVQLVDLDSANGTFIDGVQLSSNEAHPLIEVEEIQIGHLRLIFHPGDDTPTIPVNSTEDSTQPTNLGFRISLEHSAVDVWPASSSSVEIAITNSLPEEQQFQVVSQGLPDGWAKINRPVLMIDGMDTSYVLLNVKPVRRADFPPAEYLVTIRVAPIDSPEDFIELPFIVNLKGYGGFGVALSPEHIDSEDEVRLYLLNQGNEPLGLTVSGFDRSGQLSFDLPKGTVQLGAGQRTQITGKVQPQNRPLVGKPVEYPFALVVKAHTDSAYVAAVPGRVTVAPSIANWMLMSIGGVLAAILLILIVIGGQSPEPKIEAFSIAEEQIPQGSPLAMSWTGTDVSNYNIEVNGIVVVSNLNSNVNAYTLDTTDYDGDVLIKLIAQNGDAEVSAQNEVNIYVPVTIEAFDAQPKEMMRYVVGSLVVSWDLPGATSVHLSLSDNFTNAQIQASYNAVDSETLVGIPQSDVTITLYADDEVGNTTEQILTIKAIDPQCTPLDADVKLYSGPDLLYGEVGIAPRSLPVTISGISESAQWFRTELPSGITGWGQRDLYSCPDTFKPTELQLVTDIAPIPTMTPTLQSTPTAILSATPIPTQTATLPPASPTPRS